MGDRGCWQEEAGFNSAGLLLPGGGGVLSMDDDDAGRPVC